jgi:hypothetical protein
MNYDYDELGERNMHHPYNRQYNYSHEEMLEEELAKYRRAVESAMSDLDEVYEMLYNTDEIKVVGMTDEAKAKFHEHLSNAKYTLFAL